MKPLTDYEKQIINMLREDNRSLKECYTNFSFQAIAFSAAVLGILARYQPEFPYVGLASIATIFLLSTVARIGAYKYASANRQYGYELHLFRTRNLKNSRGNGWKSSMHNIGWEEAMSAWRIIQPTVFRRLYYTGWFMPNFLRREHHKQSYLWFDPKKLAKPKAVYYAGSYLSVMNIILHVFSYFASLPLFFLAFQLDAASILPLKYALILPIISVLVISYRFLSDFTRVRVLESGLLSIHACAIMWQAVVVAHYLALKKSKGYKEYTKHLAEAAESIVNHVFNIHDWVENPTL